MNRVESIQEYPDISLRVLFEFLIINCPRCAVLASEYVSSDLQERIHTLLRRLVSCQTIAGESLTSRKKTGGGGNMVMGCHRQDDQRISGSYHFPHGKQAKGVSGCQRVGPSK